MVFFVQEDKQTSTVYNDTLSYHIIGDLSDDEDML